MIKFVDDNGNIFEGQSPYIHWLNGGQSVGLWYDFKLLIITDDIDVNSPLICRGFDENSIFKFVKPDFLNESTIDISSESPALSYEYVDTSNNIVENDGKSYRLYQIHILCKSDKIGQITDSFNLSIGDYSIDVTVGGDFYTLDETLNINLGNKGFDVSPYIEKSLYDTNIQEANIDSIYINQKFKELISNYIDIIDCKGSYKSLLNSLKWFDWGDNIKMYEVWKTSSEIDFEKNIELILSDSFKHLIYTQSKTTYVSLVTALNKPTNEFDDEKNPVLENIVRKWSNDDLAIKISVLGAFFERYFLPIHMDLKRASIEAHIYTVSNKIKIGESIHNDNYMTDVDVVSIDMPHTVVIGNLNGVSVGDNTMFGRIFDPDHYEDFVDDIKFNTLYTYNFENQSIEYWKNRLGYRNNTVDRFINDYENWAIKWTKTSQKIEYDGKTYPIWKPNRNIGDILYGIIEENDLNNNYGYLRQKTILENLDNRFAPFSNFLINISDSEYESGSSKREWVDGNAQSLITVIRAKEDNTNYNIHTHYTPVGVDYVENITSNETPDTNINKVTTIYLDDFPDEGYGDDNIRVWCWAIKNSKTPINFDPNNDELPDDEECKDILNSWAQFDGVFDEACHKYEYTGENITYEGNEYQLWKDSNHGGDEEDSGLPLYGLLPVNLQYSVNIMEENSLYNNLNSRYCPFVAFLNSDQHVTYNSDVSNGYRLLIEIEYESDDDHISDDIKNTLDKLKDIKQSTAYGQLIGHVGVVVPINVSVNLPDGDGLCTEIINLYKNGIDNPPIQVVSKKLFMSENGVASFDFNLVSTKLEEVSFTLTLHSLSGHTWTASAGYKVIDISGCQLNIYKVTNQNYSTSNKEFLDLMNGNPWGTQYNTIQTIPYIPQEGLIDPKKYTPQMINQYIPMDSKDLSQYNEYIIVNNPQNSENDGDGVVNWVNSISSNTFWVIPWGEKNKYKYTLLIAKIPGIFSKTNIDNIINIIKSQCGDCYIDGKQISNFSDSTLKRAIINRHDYIFIPQLHKYTNMEDMDINMERNIYNKKFDFGGYKISQGKELLCIIPQFNHSVAVDLDSIRWEFKNMTTLETISYDIPISKPIIASDKAKSLGPGYWSVTMYFKMDKDSTEHKITKNSAFRIV